MNSVVLIGRLTKDPDVKLGSSDKSMVIAKFTLAVDRKGKKGEADFINCVSFGKTAEFFEKYVVKGTKMCVQGHIQTGSYTNKDGKKVYTTDVVVDSAEFCESKKAQAENKDDEEIEIPLDKLEEELPFA